MHTFLTVALALVAAVAFYKLHAHRSALRSLHQAMLRRQPFLREETPGASGELWDQLCVTSNDLITELNQLAQEQSSQLAHLEATLGSLQEAVLIVDSHNHILLANNALQAIFPRATEAVNQRLEVVLHSVAFLNYLEAVRRDDATPQHAIEFVDGGETRWVEVTGTTIPALDGGTGRWALFVLHDITRQKMLEQVRKEFVANVSHELRTPLSVIKGYIETLVDGHEDMNSADRNRFLNTIQRHTERLNSLLEDLLTLSRLESINPGLRRESTDVARLIEGIVEDFQARPYVTRHTLISELDPAIGELLLDPLKLTQVIGNLLDNAVKYTAPGSRIHVRGRRLAEEVVLEVEDTGQGIPAEDLPHIFERFYRVDKGRSREKGGTGLGLSIVKHIIQLHGGRVLVESRAGQGTCFKLHLPVRPAA